MSSTILAMDDNVPHFEAEDNVSKTEHRKKLNGKFILRKPEDEVVAIILSAIIGSIIERWESIVTAQNGMKPPTTTSEAENDDQLQDETRVSFGSLKSHDSTTTAKKDSINEVSSSSRSRTSNKSVHEEPGDVALHHNDQPPETTTDQLSETEHSTSDVSNISNTVSEEIEEEYEIELKSFFEHLREKIFGWEILKTDTEVVMVFKQGHSYQGKLVNCRMHGHGKFYWADGSVYVGDFYNGEMSGDGYMQWADLSWYEGQMQQGYRHGLGLFVQSVGFYTGSWQCGRRHGLGAMYYNRNNTSRDYYNGEWARDCKHGTGLRCYPSGAMYSGQWKGGVRHGLGTMVWTNNDVYSGNWENNRIHGYGEYTWETFFNEQLVVPQENCYYGSWDKGVRHGKGTLETSLGVTVRGTWKNGKKHGPAEVICSNGSFVYSDNLFTHGCISSVSDIEVDSLVDDSICSLNHYKVPVTAPHHDINLTFYTGRLSAYLNDSKRTGKTERHTTIRSTVYSKTDSNNLTPFTYNEDEKLEAGFEEILLRNVVLQYLSAMKVVYVKYSELCCKTKPTFPTVLMRLMFWQLLIDCNLHSRGLSLADFDILIGQVLFKKRNLLSLDALYWYYKGLGEPLSARNFLKCAFAPLDKNGYKKPIPNYPEHLLHGKNVIGVGGKLTYYPADGPMLPETKCADNTHPQDLTCLSGIGLLSVFQCLLKVCPNIAVGGIVINIDYKIVFLEFYELLLMCAKLAVKKRNIESKADAAEKSIEDIPEEETHIDEQVTFDEETKVSETEVKPKKLSKTKKKKK
ncbi:radial spoke head 10 homolog B-like isoform X2 [Homalodisca vitripennis]|uniref:radial spoke head 10 homolog B-like isoform X2 n=1 Tax=Homalodisca vitripennis TaxID=197043 RepID=UPI001EE9B21E|nr:radial spoke head 10 homolog B-like isoform X2 [Homalodisca vitripennis]